MKVKNPAIVTTVWAIAFAGLAYSADSSVKIGVQMPLTGERSAVGRLMGNGLQMAADDLNGRSGSIKVELVFADDASTPEGALRSINDLVKDPKIACIIGEINSPLVLASVPVINAEKLPYLTAGTSPRTTDASEWVFRVGTSDTILSNLLADYLANEMHIKTLAILHDKTGIHRQRAEMIADLLKRKYNIATLVDAGWAPGDRTFGSILAQAKATRTDAVLALGETPEGGSFLKELAASGLQSQTIAQRDFGVRRVLDEAGAAANGTLIVTEYSPDLQGEPTRAWNTNYSKHYGGDANIIAAQYYDALMLVAAAVKSGGPTKDGIRAGLQGLKQFPGIVGDYTFDGNRDGIHRLFMARVVDGRLSPVKTLTESPIH
jgi:branched-chain amino acid transport system substrate-binding protein